jgi:putative nucleic acid binding protein
MVRTVTSFTRCIARIRFQSLRLLGVLPTLALVSFVFSSGCRSQSAGASPALPVNVLVREYEDSTAEARRKYDGHEITVRGYTSEAAIMPQSGDDDQGLVLLEEKDRRPAQQVACWFSKDQAEQFSTIKSGQFITVKGIFNGEAGADLRFCKLVKIE